MEMIKKTISAFFSFLASILTLACPICFPLLGVGGVLSALGLGFLIPLGANIYFIGAIFGLAWLSMFFSAKQHQRYWILILSFLGGGLILIGRFILVYNPAIYVGLFLFLLSAILNLKFKRSCSSCKS